LAKSWQRIIIIKIFYAIKKPSKMRAFLFIKKLYFLQIVT